MSIPVPDWLKNRNGELKPSKDGHACMIYFDGQPQYMVEPLPVKGTFGCRVVQTINGKHLERGGVWPTRDEAFQGGLNDLREALGW